MDEARAAARARGRHGGGHGQARRSRRAARDEPARSVFLATATEIVLRAGEIQLARRGVRLPHRQEGRHRSRHRGRSRVRADVPRGDRRALSRSRRPGRGAERRPGEAAARAHRWVFDPLDGTTNYAHGLPIFCSSLALEDRRPGRGRRRLRSDAAGAVHRRARARARSSTAQPLRGVRGPTPLIDALLVTGFPYDVHKQGSDLVELFGAFLGTGARRAPARLGRARSLLRRRRALRRLLGAAPQAVGRRRRRADRRRGRRSGQRDGRHPVRSSWPAISSPRTGSSTTQMLERHPRLPRRTCSIADGLTAR